MAPALLTRWSWSHPYTTRLPTEKPDEPIIDADAPQASLRPARAAPGRAPGPRPAPDPDARRARDRHVEPALAHGAAGLGRRRHDRARVRPLQRGRRDRPLVPAGDGRRRG